jgi:hypothetical protein
MIQQVLSHYHLPGLACLGLLLFMAVFAGAVTWVCRRSGKEFYEAMQHIPFGDEERALK